MKKILFLIETLDCGGAERVMVNLVNALNKSKYRITVNTIFGSGMFAEQLNGDIEFHNLGFKKRLGISKLMYIIPSNLLFKHFIGKCQYDLIVSYMHGVPALIAAGAPTKKIVWIHSEYLDRGRHFLKYYSLRKCYDQFDQIVGVSNRVCYAITEKLKCVHKPITIYNTNNVERIKQLSEEHNSGICYSGVVIVSVGCLENAKGYDRLMKVCGQLKKQYLFTLIIIGEGRERKSLRRMIFELGLENRVLLIGQQDNPYPYVKRADFFVCSSRQEGLSTAVTEAIILGKPVISTDVSGAREILGEHDEYGLVVENSEEGIYAGMKRFLENPSLLSYYSKMAKERSAFFDTSSTVRQAESLFDKILGEKT